MRTWLSVDRLSSVAAGWSPLLIDAALKSVALLALASLAACLMRRFSAAARHVVWLAALAGMLVLPVISAWSPSWRVLPPWLDVSSVSAAASAPPVSPLQPLPQIARHPVKPVVDLVAGAPVSPIEVMSPHIADRSELSSDVTAKPSVAPVESAMSQRSPKDLLWLSVLAIWSVGVFTVALVILLGHVSLWRLGRRATPLSATAWGALVERLSGPLGVRRHVALMISDERWMPMAWGVLKPRILLPSEASSWPEVRRNAVLLHELAHVKRWDCATRIIVQASSALYWFNPLVWLALRRVDSERERACDDLVLAAGVGTCEYAQQLLEIAAAPRPSRFTAQAAVAMARPSSLEGRLRALLDVAINRQQVRPRAVVLIFALAVLAAVPLAMLRGAAGGTDAPASSNVAAKETPADGKPAEDEKMVLVGGVIQDEDGRPIENVELVVGLASPYGGWFRAKTNPQGRWSGEMERRVPITQLLLYHREFICSTFGHAIPSTARLLDRTAVMVMKRGLPIEGIVLDEEGEPIVGAIILTQPYNIMEELDRDPTTARSQADGTFRVSTLPAGRGGLAVYADSYAPRVVPIDVHAGMERITVQLGTGHALRGSVVDASDQPVAGATVEVYEWLVNPSFPLRRSVETDQDGLFSLPDMPADTAVSLRCSKGDYHTTEWETTTDVSPAGKNEQRIKLYEPTTIVVQVLDKKTRRPVQEFQLIEGRRWSADKDIPKVVFRQEWSTAVTSPDGHFKATQRTTIKEGIYPGFAVRVVADGYLPAETPLVMIGQRIEPVCLLLERGKPITGTVVDSQDHAVRDAEVAWVGPGRMASITEGQVDKGITYRPESIVKTDLHGRFELPSTKEKGLLFVLHETGYAHVKSQEHDASQPIILIPWAKVEGVLKSGSKPVFGGDVWLQPNDPTMNTLDSPIYWRFNQKTHTDGKFAFDFVPSIELVASRSAAFLPSHKAALTPKPGETVRIQLGGAGGSVQGRLERPTGVQIGAFSDQFAADRACTQVVAYPIKEARLKKEARSNFVAFLSEDGSFTITDLPPGRYELTATVHAPVPANSCGLPVPIALGRTQFDVVENEDQSIDPVELQAATGARTGQLVPDLAGKMLDGRAFDLAELRGKIVLLDFWATWCAPCKKATPRLRLLHTRYSENVAFVGVNLDADELLETALQYTTDAGVPWPQVSVGAWGEGNPVLRSFLVTSVPSFWLIAPDGKVLARDIPLESLEGEIRQALAR